MPQEPVKADQGVTALDRTGVDQRLDLGERLDNDADVFVLFGKAVHPSSRGGIDAATKQDHAFVRIA